MKTQKNSVRRSLILSATALMISVAMLIGTTFAWFTDSVSSGKNKIVAGNLDVELEYLADKENNTWKPVTEDTTLFSDVETGSTTKNLWEPNHTEVAYLRVRNAGTLALNYTLNVTPVDEVGGISAKDGSSFKLSDSLVFGEAKPVTETIYATRNDAQAAVAGQTQSLNQDKLKAIGTLSPETGDTKVYQYINLVIYMPSTVGNEANYKTGTTPPSIDFGVTLYATQAVEEKDSFDDKYDEKADLTPDNVGKDNITSDYTPQVNQTATITRDDTGITGVEGADLDADSGTITMTSTAVVDGTPAAKAVVPTNAVADDANEITLSVTKTDKPNGITVTSDEASSSLNVEVAGIKAGNSELVKVELFIGKGLQGLKMYHNEKPMTVDADLKTADTYTYDSETGIVTIAVTSFSPFTAVYDALFAEVNGTSYKTIDDAISAAKNGDVVKVLKDTDVAQTIVVENKTITLDLNGKKLYNTKDLWNGRPNDWSIISVRGTGNLTITGNGVIDAKKDDCYGIDVYDAKATCTIENGTITGNITAVYVNPGKLLIKGGTFDIKQLNTNQVQNGYGLLINCKDEYYTDKTATVTITGGSYVNFDPANNRAEGAGTNFCADGYTTTSTTEEGKTIYTVVKSENTADSNSAAQ